MARQRGWKQAKGEREREREGWGGRERAHKKARGRKSVRDAWEHMSKGCEWLLSLCKYFPSSGIPTSSALPSLLGLSHCCTSQMVAHSNSDSPSGAQVGAKVSSWIDWSRQPAPTSSIKVPQDTFSALLPKESLPDLQHLYLNITFQKKFLHIG